MNPEYNREDLERIIRETFDSLSEKREREIKLYWFGSKEQFEFIDNIFKEELLKQFKDES